MDWTLFQAIEVHKVSSLETNQKLLNIYEVLQQTARTFVEGGDYRI